MTAEDMKALVERLQPIVDRGEKANLYIDMKDYEGSELGVVAEKIKHMGMLWKAIDKYAIVGAPRWMEIWSKVIDPRHASAHPKLPARKDRRGLGVAAGC